MKIINPATERVLKNLKTDDASDIAHKYQFAQDALNQWRLIPLQQRIEVVAKFAALLQKHQERLAQTLTSEMGKPITQSRNEIKGALGRIQYFLEHSQKYLEDEVVYAEAEMKEVIHYEPLGVIANISAWNYPYLVGVNVFIPALIGGNAVLYKPSEFAHLTGLELQKLWNQSGLTPYAFQVITGGADSGRELLTLPLDGYFFTGSYQTGHHIYQSVAPKMVPCQMELGGKDPLYITANNSKLHKVAEAVVEGAFYNNGQSCCAVERIYAHKDIYHDFINHFVQGVKQLKLGDPTNEEVFIGPLARPQQIEFLEAQVADALEKGAKVLSGGKAETRQGYYFQPTVIINTNHQMRIMMEETFGPVIGIQMVQNDQEALQLMRDTDYGLTASVFSDDQAQAQAILNQLPTGSGYWNCSDRVSPRLPWSGRGHSGFGTTLSHLGIRAFVQPKAFHLRSNL